MTLSSEYLLGVLCLFGGLFLWQQLIKKRIRWPPGPWALPILGNVLQVGRKPNLTFLKWSKIYGPIFKIKLGSINAVVVHDHKLMKELFSDSGATGRMMDNPLIYEFTRGAYGVINNVGTDWEQQRRFTLRTLRDFGFAKTSMENIILDEVSPLTEWFRKSDGKPIPANRVFNAPVVNALWRIVTGKRCEWEKNQTSMLDTLTEFINSANEVTSNGLFFAPVLRYIAPGYFGWNRYLKSINNIFTMFHESIKKHKETFDPDDLRNLIDHHLKEMKNTTDPESSFYKEKGDANLVAGIFDLFLAGSETTANTLTWSLLYLGRHEEIQRKLQSEIDLVLGSELPSLSKRNQMPYVEATISEILRLSSVLLLGVPHCTETDITFHGYDLPKGTAIFTNIHGIHNDPDIWGDPENFRPSRFLSEDGKSVVRHEAMISFSEGKRKCIGETMARDTLFLNLVSIFQQFNVKINDKEGGHNFESELGLLYLPKPFEVVMESRNK